MKVYNRRDWKVEFSPKGWMATFQVGGKWVTTYPKDVSVEIPADTVIDENLYFWPVNLYIGQKDISYQVEVHYRDLDKAGALNEAMRARVNALIAERAKAAYEKRLAEARKNRPADAIELDGGFWATVKFVKGTEAHDRLYDDSEYAEEDHYFRKIDVERPLQTIHVEATPDSWVASIYDELGEFVATVAADSREAVLVQAGETVKNLPENWED